MTAAFELILCLMILGTACVALLVRDFLAATGFFVVFGNLMGLAWLALGAVNVALAEIAIGAGVTGVLLILTRSRLLALGDGISGGFPPRWLTLGGDEEWNGMSPPRSVTFLVEDPQADHASPVQAG